MSVNGRKFFCHSYKSKTISSKKSAQAREIQMETMDSVESCLYPNKIWRKLKKKKEKLSVIHTTISNPLYPATYLECNQVMFDCFHDDPILHDLLPMRELFQPLVMDNVYMGLDIQDNILGSKLMETDCVPIYIHVPREDVVKHSSSSHGDVQAIKKLLLEHNNINVRGSKRTGVSYQYATFGVHAQRFGGGLSMKSAKDNCHNEYLRLLKLKARAEFFAKMYLPFRVLTALSRCKEQLSDTFSPDPRQNFQDCIWSSMATSVNYMSAAHTDEDGFLCCLTVSFIPKDWQGKFMYTLNMAVACYFCFPEHGVAVGLRPGDMLFFNPLHYHCMSQRTEDYKEEEVYVTSFYIKSKQFSGNSNCE